MNDAIVCLGILVLIVGAFLCIYWVEYSYSVFGQTLYTRVEYPYREYGFILSLMGIIILVVGLAIPRKLKQPAPKQPMGNIGYCPYCGAKIVQGEMFCRNCGKALP